MDDYLAAVDRICRENGIERATTGDIAQSIGVAKGTASGVLKSLADQGLLDLLPYVGACLTEMGQRRAASVVRRQRGLAIFLARTLGMSKENAADEAWRLEPVASDELLAAIEDWSDIDLKERNGLEDRAAGPT